MELELVTPANEIGNDDAVLFTARHGDEYYVFSGLPIGKPFSLFMAPCDSDGKLIGSVAQSKIVDCDSLKHGLEILGVTIKGLP